MGRRKLTPEQQIASAARRKEKTLLWGIENRERKRASLQRWRAANPEKALAQSRRSEVGRVRDKAQLAAQNRAYYLANKEAHRERCKQYNLQHAGELQAKAAARYKATDPEVIRARNKAIYAANPEQRKADAKAWRKANQHKPEYQAMKKAWRENNRIAVRASNAAWKKRNLNQGADSAQLRRARLKTAGPIEKIKRLVVWERDGGLCHLCGLAADPSNWHLDHIKPVARGGTHTYNNVAVTHPACNQRKNAREVPSVIPLNLGAVG